MHSNRSVKK